jgi:ABC-type methionine transport system ATPase subunit
VLELLLDLRERQGLTILLVSHQLGLVRETVRQVLWVAHGRVVRGTAAELLRPENLDRVYSAGGTAVGENA